MSRTPVVSEWQIVTFKEPVMWNRSEEETWCFNPVTRYVLNANQLELLKEHIDTISELKGSRFYTPLQGGMNLRGKKILIERYRERGIGDLLFLTGPLSYINKMTAGTCKQYVYALADRGQVLNDHPCVAGKRTLAGPTHYTDFQDYDAQWMIDTVTEYSEEYDQLNVYDALYRQLGIDPMLVEPKFKRPSMQITPEDTKKLDSLMFAAWREKQLDLRKNPYFVVAPLANSNLRSMSYTKWIHIITNLLSKGPVCVIGNVHEQVPVTDMDVGTFYQHLAQISAQKGVPLLNLLGLTGIRLAAALIGSAKCVVTLDSGSLYMAQAQRVPAISLWGAHHPSCRIGYDHDYMNLVIHKAKQCPHSPCYSYSGFPYDKCPRGGAQKVCEVLDAIDSQDVMAKLAILDDVNAGKLVMRAP